MADTPELLNECMEQLLEAGPEAAPARVLWSQIPLLVASSEAADALVTYTALAESFEDPRHEAAQRLLETLLDEAHRADVDGKPEGKRFLEAADAAGERVAATNATNEGLVALGVSYTRAGLEVPEPIRAAYQRRLSEADQADAAPPQDPAGEMAAAIDAMMADAGDDLYWVYKQMSESLASMGEPECRALIQAMAQWDHPRYAELVTYWLLDPRRPLAEAAAKALAERAQAGGLDDATAGRLVWIRQVLPPNELVAELDRALDAHRKQRRQWPRLATRGAAETIYASLPDGVGAQYLMFGRREGDAATWSLVLIKAGLGIRDAYVLSGLDNDAEGELFDSLSGAVDLVAVSAWTAEGLLGVALAEDQAADEPPPPGLVDAAVAGGLDGLRPEPVEGPDWLARLDPDAELDALTPQKRGRLINASADWSQRLIAVETWLEDDAAVRSILTSDFIDSPAGYKRTKDRLRRELEQRREYWAERIFRTAWVAADSQLSDLVPSMVATGRALVEDRPLRKIPIMEAIIEATIEAGLEGQAAPPPPEGPAQVASGTASRAESVPTQAYEQGHVLQPFFDTGKGAEVWPAGYYGLHGYLFAVVTHPDIVAPSAWLEPLLGGPDTAGVGFESKSEAEPIIDALMSLYNALNQQMLDRQYVLPAGVELTLDGTGRPPAPLQQWAAGFWAAIETHGHLEQVVHDDFDDESEAANAVTMLHFTARALAEPERIDTILAEEDEPIRVGELIEQLLPSLPAHLDSVVRIAAAYRDAKADSAPMPEAPAEPIEPGPPQPARSEKVGRNEPCPCGSGRKYKRCCGDPARS